VPADSRAAKPHGFLQADAVTDARRAQVARLREIAAARGASVAELALAWALRDPVVTSALVGASSVGQLEQNVAAAHQPPLSADELAAIERALVDPPGGS
jgi:L-glyceraldehyde 3-phosphate reductase